MDKIIAALTLTIAKYAACVRRFTTRITNLKKEKTELDRRIARAEKSCKDLVVREETVKLYLSGFPKNSVKHKESLVALDELAARWPALDAKAETIRAAMKRNSAMLESACKSLATCERKLSEAERDLAERKKAARKAERHARNRADARARKEARRKTRLSKRETSPEEARAERSIEIDALKAEVERIAAELEVDLDSADPDDRVVVLELAELSLVEDAQASA